MWFEGVHCEVREEECASDDPGAILSVAFSNVLELEMEFLQDDMLLLTESDIPGASLNGKSPAKLNVV